MSKANYNTGVLRYSSDSKHTEYRKPERKGAKDAEDRGEEEMHFPSPKSLSVFSGVKPVRF